MIPPKKLPSISQILNCHFIAPIPLFSPLDEPNSHLTTHLQSLPKLSMGRKLQHAEPPQMNHDHESSQCLASYGAHGTSDPKFGRQTAQCMGELFPQAQAEDTVLDLRLYQGYLEEYLEEANGLLLPYPLTSLVGGTSRTAYFSRQPCQLGTHNPDESNTIPEQLIPRVIHGSQKTSEKSGPLYRDKFDSENVVDLGWGLSKAGKPRKRLPEACVNCRYKKIKCHPGSPKCLPCRKSGKECRFELT